MTLREPTPEEREQWDLAQIKQGRSRLFARPIGSVMRKLLSEKDYAAAQSAQDLTDAWTRIVGQPLASSTRPGKIAKGVLLVEVANSLALQEIHFEKSRILKALQTELPAHKLVDLRFRVVTH
ncbi:MAG: DUF721 domain-containing protein [Aureliella sp.]|jgi:predicted nucleic acid-binding Zn ribbon protein